MSYWATHLMGESEVGIELDVLPALYDELAKADSEHTDVSITHESEWCLSAFNSGLLVWENVAGEGGPMHLKNAAKEKVISLWYALAQGRIEEVNREQWAEGYGN